MKRVISHIRRLRRDSEGAAMVELALILPVMLVMFAVTIEGTRMMWSYQATIAGVRDAARYVGRSEQTSICDTGGDVSGWEDIATSIILETSGGSSVFPASIVVDNVRVTLVCATGDFRLQQTPIVTVAADLKITYPFQSVFEWVGVNLVESDTTVTDSSRVFGA